MLFSKDTFAMKSLLLFSFWTSVSWGLGLAMSILVVQIMTPPFDSSIAQALTDLEYLTEQIERFHSKTNQYPNTHKTLVEALYEKKQRSSLREKKESAVPVLQIPITDPWGQAYRYRFPGIHHANFDLFSFGQDGQLNTQDDVNNWDQSNLEAAYEPPFVRKLFRDNPLLGLLLFWFGMTVLVEAVLIIRRQVAFLKRSKERLKSKFPK